MKKVIYLKPKAAGVRVEFNGESIFCPLCGSANRFMHGNSADLSCGCGAVIPARAIFDIMVASGKAEKKQPDIYLSRKEREITAQRL